MASSIKMKDKDKERLDKLKAKLLLNGINMNQEQLLSKLLDLGENFLFDLNSIPIKKISSKRKKTILSRSIDMGSSSEQSIDLELYGEK